MNKKISLVSLILVFALFTNGCSQEVSLIETTKDYVTIYSNDNISIKISNTVKDNENIYNTILESLQKINSFSPIHKIEIDIDEKYIIPKVEGSIKCNSNFAETEEFRKELIKRSYDIYDNWISEGLYAKIFDAEKKDLEFSNYYKNHEFSLFGARFFEPFASKDEVENVQAASIDLVGYLIKEGKKEQLLKNQIEISDIEEWAKDKNIDLSYQQSIDSLMNRMEVNKLKSNIYLTINTKEDINGFIIDIQTIDEQYDTAKKIEKVILDFDSDIVRIKEGIKKDAPNFYNDYREKVENIPKIHYYFNINEKINYAEMGRKIFLKHLLEQAHEYSHILHFSLVNYVPNTGIPEWLMEGMATYLDVLYSDAYKFKTERTLNFFYEVKENKYEFSEEGKEDFKKYYDYITEIFDKNDINLNDIDLNYIYQINENKNQRLKLAIMQCVPVAFPYKIIGTEDVMTDRIFGIYLFGMNIIEEYGLEKLLYLAGEQFMASDYEKHFGKSYEELVSDWVEYVKEILELSN
ncbi:hypothetical protein NE686_04520 [Tissierella carlieri]|uniref:Lipoprotein n=1 Tax=Tissierella carlieri TaxID=689904 RepID=A0ABT1S789_9FIRM|nr:hypothetical protein [Tissierella carlieri]MCQ4922338.1 hypothetical protein [Tissierella carlieri]